MTEAVFIDNWSLFNGEKKIFLNVIEKYSPNNLKYTVIESDCWNIPKEQIINFPKFNIYLYDGGHTYTDHYNAIKCFYQFLDTNCILLIDDWNWNDVRNGTLDALKDLNIKIKYKHEILTEQPHYIKGKTTYWNGIGIFII